MIAMMTKTLFLFAHYTEEQEQVLEDCRHAHLDLSQLPTQIVGDIAFCVDFRFLERPVAERTLRHLTHVIQTKHVAALL